MSLETPAGSGEGKCEELHRQIDMVREKLPDSRLLEQLERLSDDELVKLDNALNDVSLSVKSIGMLKNPELQRQAVTVIREYLDGDRTQRDTAKELEALSNND